MMNVNNDVMEMIASAKTVMMSSHRKCCFGTEAVKLAQRTENPTIRVPFKLGDAIEFPKDMELIAEPSYGEKNSFSCFAIAEREGRNFVVRVPITLFTKTLITEGGSNVRPRGQVARDVQECYGSVYDAFNVLRGKKIKIVAEEHVKARTIRRGAHPDESGRFHESDFTLDERALFTFDYVA